MAKEIKDCPPCPYCGWIVLVVGILFLLKDLGVWAFFGVAPWTAAFILFGLFWAFKKK